MKEVYSPTNMFYRIIKYVVKKFEQTKIREVGPRHVIVETELYDYDENYIGTLLSDIDNNISLTYIVLADYTQDKYDDLSD